MKSVLALTAAFVAVTAAPTPLEGRQAAPFDLSQSSAAWDAGATREWRIHPSCNASQALQLRKGLDEAVQLAQHAKDHVTRWYNESEVYQKYFGNAHYTEVIGAYDIIIHGDRAHALFRCDDPDGNCVNNPTWGGHYRGSNATEETVICPVSFFQRRYLSQICSQGWNVRQSSRLIYWSSDLIHRLFHVPVFGQGYIDHYSEGYENIVGNATANNPNAVRDSDGLQYFALEAYAHDIILPGVGCPGPVGPISKASSAAVAASTSAAAGGATSATSTRVTSSTAASAASATALPDNCHTHADGSVHCV